MYKRQGKDYTLDEVVIKGEQPLVKVEEGKLSYDLSRLIEHKVVNNACLLYTSSQIAAQNYTYFLYLQNFPQLFI